MGIIATQGSDDRELVPEGIYTGRCYQVIDLGTQTWSFQGEDKRQRKILINWELLTDPKMSDGRPFAISKQYTLSLHEKSNLYGDLVAWRGKKFTAAELEGFDVTSVIGAYAQLQVGHEAKQDGGNFAKVISLMAAKDKPEAVNPNVLFSLSEPDWAVFDKLPTWLQDKIKSSPEYASAKLPTTVNGDMDEPQPKQTPLDDIPF